MRTILAIAGLCTLLGVTTHSVAAASTAYPLTVENCGVKVTFTKAPQRAVGLGQGSAEIMMMLGLDDKMVGTAFWPNKPMPQLADAYAKVNLLSIEFPTFESVLAQQPDFVAAALPSLMGPSSKVSKREDFDKLGIPAYLSPSACVGEGVAKDKFGYGNRDQLWNMTALYHEIKELSQIFDVSDRGEALIENLKKREAALRGHMPKDGKKLSYLFWFSSPSPAADAYLAGKNTPSGFIAEVLGGTNAITSEADSPALGWESIIAANPDVIVVAQVDRNRWELDKAEAKVKFLKTDSGTSQMPAVKNNAIVIMEGQAMNPTIQTIFGAEKIAEQLKVLGLR
ncbi:ABC transporter substrate-binding protein [Neorhizobium sp. AL 9.2.2]|uniref:ABC transporter substrate-binding protein n=1 Tax=Neorhizobium sp. AL 9.2.2 TaxID=2712894 RepID=UPI001572433E|nr:ABC transporter substrate-binding protein [Neorhizobium sp. AL 9.2.2]NSY20182.1 ABC transporter substrate-binding protein [Neorhizobium sp. AL 9.2.2]